jgi:hypothetical protein
MPWSFGSERLMTLIQDWLAIGRQTERPNHLAHICGSSSNSRGVRASFWQYYFPDLQRDAGANLSHHSLGN